MANRLILASNGFTINASRRVDTHYREAIFFGINHEASGSHVNAKIQELPSEINSGPSFGDGRPLLFLG